MTTGGIEKRLEDEPDIWDHNESKLHRLRSVVGLSRRYVAPPAITSLDLCRHSAQKISDADPELLEGADGLIFVTQTPDYFQPANANILHGLLGLSSGCACFDVNLGCSGWVYGYYLASLMIESGGCKKIILAAGDTIAQIVDPGDKATAPLFGDAGSITIIEKTAEETPTWFALHSDGSGRDAIQQLGGAYRSNEFNNYNANHFLKMDGAAVFNFSMREEPAAIMEILSFAGLSKKDIDWFFLHQANKYIIDTIIKKIGLAAERVPADIIGLWGNQSSVSIPGVVCATFDNNNGGVPKERKQTCLYSGFGVGLSWASAISKAPVYPTSWDHFPVPRV